MLTPEIEAWLSTLPNDKVVTILPFDPTAEEKYQKVKQQIQNVLGEGISVVHRGSTSLGISGQSEIDIYVPSEPSEFDALHKKLVSVLGKPHSILPLQRIRWSLFVDGKRADVFLSNVRHSDWIEGVAFECICKTTPHVLRAYEKLKQESNGWTVQDFYRKKAQFIDAVLSGKI